MEDSTRRRRSKNSHETGAGDSPGAQWNLNSKGRAKLLGVSRKTYYEWEEKSLKAMAQALENHPAGRPPASIDPEKETLREQIRELEKELDLAKKTIEVKELLGAYEEFRHRGSKKKTDRSTRSDKKSCGDC